MWNRTGTAACTLIAATALLPLQASAADNVTMWAANPAGVQTVPNAPALTLLPSGGYVPLKTTSGKCLLVARRGTQIVAVELTPVTNGAKLAGWTPQVIDMNTLTSKWGYHADPSGSAVTSSIAGETRTDVANGAYATSRQWGNTHVQTMSTGESESASTVTANGKTYRTYSHFKPASVDTPVAASDEYFCQ